MANNFRRALSVLCALALCFALLPAAALASGSGYGVKDFAFYYLYDGVLPGNPGGKVESPAPYGPSGDDVPFRLVKIDLDKLFEALPGAEASWERNRVVTAESSGYHYPT